MVARRYLTTDQIALTWGWASRAAVREFCRRHRFPLLRRGRVLVAEAREFELFIQGHFKVASRRPQQVREQHNAGTEFGDVHSGESMHTAARNRPNSFGAR